MHVAYLICFDLAGTVLGYDYCTSSLLTCQTLPFERRIAIGPTSFATWPVSPPLARPPSPSAAAAASNEDRSDGDAQPLIGGRNIDGRTSTARGRQRAGGRGGLTNRVGRGPKVPAGRRGRRRRRKWCGGREWGGGGRGKGYFGFDEDV